MDIINTYNTVVLPLTSTSRWTDTLFLGGNYSDYYYYWEQAHHLPG